MIANFGIYAPFTISQILNFPNLGILPTYPLHTPYILPIYSLSETHISSDYENSKAIDPSFGFIRYCKRRNYGAGRPDVSLYFCPWCRSWNEPPFYDETFNCAVHAQNWNAALQLSLYGKRRETSGCFRHCRKNCQTGD